MIDGPGTGCNRNAQTRSTKYYSTSCPAWSCESQPLRFGVFITPFHHRAIPTVALEYDMERVVALDRLGFDEAWFGEHHSGGYELIACPEVFIAAAAERTKHIRLGTGVVSLPTIR
ncbi:luciferase-like monooxygenase family protein [Mycobacterium xenopi 3993]|nr:luciferase-like monooxygenase family protein [Mycobacterium xenopi 3993]